MSDRVAFMSELSDRLLERRPSERALLVGIDGMSCAGKSRFADALCEALAARTATAPLRLSLDDFHAPAARRYRRGRDSAEGYYQDCFENGRFRETLLDPLENGRYPIVIPTAIFDYRTDQPVERIAPVGASDIVIVDGLFLLRSELAGGWDVVMLLDIDEADALARAFARDLELSAARPRSSGVIGSDTFRRGASIATRLGLWTAPTSSSTIAGRRIPVTSEGLGRAPIGEAQVIDSVRLLP